MKSKLGIMAILLLTALLLRFPALAESQTGACGDNLTWTLDSAGTLTISGTGAMYSYGDSQAPWGKKPVRVVIENGVTNISHDAFLRCGNLTSVSIPDSVVSIDSYAFYLCGSLTGVTIPSGVTSIGEGAFADCRSLKNIAVSTENKDFVSIDGVVFNAEKTKIVVYPAGKTGDYAIPSGVTNIGACAFCGCDKLTGVTIPDSVTGIGLRAFDGCSSLTSIVLPFGVQNIALQTFDRCSNLTSVTLPAGVSELDFHTFHSCNRLAEITILGMHTDISELIKFARNIKMIYCLEGSKAEAAAKQYNKPYTLITDSAMPAPTPTPTPTPAPTPTPDHTVPTSEICGDHLIWTLGSAGTLTISGTGAMYDYDSENGKTTAPWGTKPVRVVIENGVTRIGKNAFCGCASLVSISIPKSVTDICYHAFRGCKNLSGIVLPESVVNIYNYAFCGCESLTHVTIPKGVSRIENFTFKDCSGLSSITIPEGVIRIGDFAFQNCESLTSVTLPGSLASIGRSAFERCSRLTDVTVPNRETVFERFSVFLGCSGRLTIHCDENSKAWIFAQECGIAAVPLP